MAKSASTGGSSALQRGVGDRGAAQAGLVGVDPALHRGDRDGKILLAHGAAGDLDDVLEQPRILQPAAQQTGRVRVLFRAQQAVERRRVAGQVIGQRRRGTEHRGNPVEQAGIALEQRQQLHAGGLARQERVEPVEHRVRLRLAGQRGQHARQQLRQQLAGAGRAQRAHVPCLPAAHRGDDALGVAEAEGVRSVGVGGFRRRRRRR